MTLTSDAGGTVQGVAANASSVTYTIFGDEITQGVTGGAVSSVEGRIGVVTLGDLYQALDSELTAIAGLTSAADKVPYFTGSGTASLATLTSFIRTLLAAVDAPAARTVLGTAPQVTTFLSGSGNYTIPTGATTLLVQLQAAGSGGGSGRRGAAGSARGGGGPGANGAYVEFTVNAAELLVAQGSSSIFYSVGSAGAGGAAVTANDTNGNPGAATVSAQGTWIGKTASINGVLYALARTSSSGAGGTTAVGGAGAGLPGTTPATPTGGLSLSGAGGTVSAADVPGNGSNATGGTFSGQQAGTGGVVGGASPTAGLASGLLIQGPYPGGGAASITGAAQAGADALANSGAGGAGGGASLNGNNSGAGGAGGSGYLRITAT